MCVLKLCQAPVVMYITAFNLAGWQNEPDSHDDHEDDAIRPQSVTQYEGTVGGRICPRPCIPNEA